MRFARKAAVVGLAVMVGMAPCQRLAAAAAPETAEDPGISVCSLYTMSTSTSLRINNGKAKMHGEVVGIPGVTKLVAKLTLQKYVDGGWKAVNTDPYKKTVTDSIILSMDREKAVASGKRFRLKAVYEVSYGGKTETITKHSGEACY